jgi:hypothetical protein
VFQESYPFDSRRWYHCGVRGSNINHPDQCALVQKKISVLNQVKGTSLNEIRIVREFLDVFLEDLLGMPPH